MIKAKLKLDKDKWLLRLTEGLYNKFHDSDNLCHLSTHEINEIDKLVEAHLDDVLNKISEFDLVARL